MHIVLTMESGGLESVVFDLCRGTKNSVFQPEILCLQRYDASYADRLAAEGIPINLISKKSKFDIGYFFRVAGFLKKRNIKIVHAHSGCFFYAAIFVLLARIPRFVYTAHGMSILNRLQDKIEDNLAGFVCDKVLAVSTEIVQHLKERMPMAKKKIIQLTNGIDTEKYKPFATDDEKLAVRRKFLLPEEAFLVGTVGRLAPEKNYQMLLRAFASFNKLVSDQPKHLVFIGDGYQRSDLERLSEELGLVGLVQFLGNQYDIHKILPMLDIFALSSHTEGTSISLLEAQSCAIPAVVTDVGGNSSVVRHAETGFVCTPDDHQAFAAAILELSNDVGIISSMRRAARDRIIDCFSLHCMVENYSKTYLEKIEEDAICVN